MSSEFERPPREQIFLSVVDTYPNVDLNRGSCNDTDSRTRVELSEALRGRCAVMLVFGQSNGANSGDTPYTPKGRVFNFNLFDGQCYVARDPLLGATEQRGNFAGRLGDMLIERDSFDSVILTTISVGGSRAEEWTTGGSRHRRLQLAIKRAQDAGLRYTHLLWHQGESNAQHDPDPEIYLACIRNINAALRRYGVDAPLYVAQATIAVSPPHKGIRAAQRAAVEPALGILPGPDTDTIGAEHRFDGCHMAESGLIRHAELWAEALQAPPPKPA